MIVGLDHYHENIQSHSWQEDVGTRMHMFKAEEWVQMFEAAGFSQVESCFSIFRIRDEEPIFHFCGVTHC